MTALVREPVTALAPAERDEFIRHEGVIAAGLKTFVAVGNALVDIRDRRLYREEYDTFDEYCRERWNMTRQRAYQLIDSSAVVAAMSTIVDKPPENEAQARPLVGLTHNDQVDTWSHAQHLAGDARMTARVVETAREELDELRSAVRAAGGVWYGSRDGQHMVGLPDTPDRRYNTEQLREALGITTVEASPAPAAPLPAPPLPDRPAEPPALAAQTVERGALACANCGAVAKVLYGGLCQGCYTTQIAEKRLTEARHAGPGSEDRRLALESSRELLQVMPAGPMRDLLQANWRQLDAEYQQALKPAEPSHMIKDYVAELLRYLLPDLTRIDRQALALGICSDIAEIVFELTDEELERRMIDRVAAGISGTPAEVLRRMGFV